jgi:energy-coupling factor transporter ATP-binding protein EcfA2
MEMDTRAPDESLPLQSFDVDRFRAIRELSLPTLARVNLFVGRNNAGKTSLLEAIRLYLHRNSTRLPAVLLDIVRSHSDYRPAPLSFAGRRESLDSATLQAAADAVESLFFGSFEHDAFAPIRLTPEPMPSTGLTLRLPWQREVPTYDVPQWRVERDGFFAPDSSLIELDSEANHLVVPFDWFVRRVPILRAADRHPSLMIGSGGLDARRMREMWDAVALAGHDNLVEDALRAIVPDLDRILLVGESGRRSILLKLSNAARPVPIQSMGDGFNRVFGIALGLILSRGGALLLDEVENGLHHSVQHEVWQATFALAQRFDVQVFATTHSWDAVVGFQAAANQSDAAGLLYRLERDADGEIYAERYTEEEVAVAADQQVEVR